MHLISWCSYLHVVTSAKPCPPGLTLKVAVKWIAFQHIILEDQRSIVIGVEDFSNAFQSAQGNGGGEYI
jgi:hypothetical protein